MHILRHHTPVPRPLQGGVYALGNFDGVHKGHQMVIDEARRVAKELNAPLGVLVFEPHPKQFFFPNEPFFRLTPFRAKARLLASLGVDVLAALPFDAAMAKRQAPEFILDVLVNGLHAAHVVAGYDFRFGKGLAAGDPRGAADLLGHWWTVETHVMTGDQRGRTIGFPTANLALEDHVQPALGVYAVRVEIEDGPHKGHYDGVANFGKRPTFDKKDVILEVHLFDFDGDIYGHHIAVGFVDYLRPEQKFDGLDALKAQIAKDSAKAREILANLDAAVK